jgi:formiminotetrahydrofolate cyclodeaminase
MRDLAQPASWTAARLLGYGTAMEDFAQLSINDFLDRLSARTPTPGGGGAAACVVALGCAQAGMVVRYSIRRSTPDDDRARAEQIEQRLTRLDSMARELMSADAEAFEQMTAAQQACKEMDSADEQARARAAYQRAVVRAIGVPVEIAALAGEALGLLNAFKGQANRYLVSDLGVAAALMAAGTRSAQYLVGVNLPELEEAEAADTLRDQIAQLMTICSAHHQEIHSFVAKSLQADEADNR